MTRVLLSSVVAPNFAYLVYSSAPIMVKGNTRHAHHAQGIGRWMQDTLSPSSSLPSSARMAGVHASPSAPVLHGAALDAAVDAPVNGVDVRSPPEPELATSPPPRPFSPEALFRRLRSPAASRDWCVVCVLVALFLCVCWSSLTAQRCKICTSRQPTQAGWRASRAPPCGRCRGR